jgi:hypothetical protein
MRKTETPEETATRDQKQRDFENDVLRREAHARGARALNLDELSLKTARDGALEWIENLIRLHESGVRTLKARKQELIDSFNPVPNQTWSPTPIQVLSWTVNDINNINMNHRLDLAVNHTAALIANDPARNRYR